MGPSVVFATTTNVGNTASAKSTKKYNPKNHPTESNNNPERSSGRSVVNFGPDGGRTENQRGDSIVRERKKKTI